MHVHVSMSIINIHVLYVVTSTCTSGFHINVHVAEGAFPSTPRFQSIHVHTVHSSTSNISATKPSGAPTRSNLKWPILKQTPHNPRRIVRDSHDWFFPVWNHVYMCMCMYVSEKTVSLWWKILLVSEHVPCLGHFLIHLKMCTEHRVSFQEIPKM